MTTTIELGDTKIRYASIAEARAQGGLRLVLGNYTIPGPWREVCKSLFQVKRIPFVPVVTGNAGTSDAAMGMGGSQSELIAWTGQASQPVAVWNDERPRASWIDQLNLAERLAPEPALVPAGIEDRVRMFGLINEIAGEFGLTWYKRILTIHAKVSAPAGPDDSARPFFDHVGAKYGYSAAHGARAAGRIVEVLDALDAQLARQRAAGHRYLMGPTLTALDLHWACACGFLDPLPPELCPMATAFRSPDIYGNGDPAIARALTPALRAHRDFIYETHLELPVVF